MIRRFGFYDRHKNPDAKGIEHKYIYKKINGDNVVFDEATGLMWQQSGTSLEIALADAEKWLLELNQKGFAGFNDWRLPTLEEAMSLMEPINKNKRYINPIFESLNFSIWTSDLQLQGGEQTVWVVMFNFGMCDWVKIHFSHFVRAVHFRQVHQRADRLAVVLD